MRKFVFYRGKKITMLLVISSLLAILRDIIVPYNESARYSQGLYSSSQVVAVCFNLLIIALVIYKSIAVYKIDNKCLTYGNIFKREMFFSRIVEITSSEKYIIFTSLEGNRRVSLNVNNYIFLDNVDLYREFFDELLARIDIDEISIDDKAKEILLGQKLITIESLNTPKPKIRGWLLYITIGMFGSIYTSIFTLTGLSNTTSFNFQVPSYFQEANTAISIFFVVFTVVALVFIFSRKKTAPKLLIAKEWTAAILGIVLLVIAEIIRVNNNETLEWYEFIKYIFSSVNTIIMAFVYTIYYNTSIRIKKTFGLMSDEEYKQIYGDYAAEKTYRDNITVIDEPNEVVCAPKTKRIKSELKAEDFAEVTEYLNTISNMDSKNKITIMLFGKVKYQMAKKWYKEIEEALNEDFIAINKIVASPDSFDKNHIGYKPSDEYEEIYLDQIISGTKGVQLKSLGFLCAYLEADDYILDSFCFGDMSWGSDVCREGMKISFDLKTASEIDVFKYIEIFNKYISLFHIHIFEIDYSKGVKLKKQNNDLVEYNKSKKLILDLEL